MMHPASDTDIERKHTRYDYRKAAFAVRKRWLYTMSGFSDNGAEIREKNRTEAGTLYLLASPIGNLADISERTVKVLSECSFVAAEDTRVSGKLLSSLGISKPMVPYHEHNKQQAGAEIVRRLRGGETCALMTDAGTPGISDPGSDIVRACIDGGIPVTSVPGCCAAINALILSGFDTRRFCFEGFLPEKKKELDERLSFLRGERRTMIFYSSPHDLRRVLASLSEYFGAERRVALCREMTKLNEEIERTTLGAATESYTERAPRGEYVLVLEGARGDSDAFWHELSVPQHVAYYEEKGMKHMDAVKAVAADRGVAKNIIYKAVLDEK